MGRMTGGLGGKLKLDSCWGPFLEERFAPFMFCKVGVLVNFNKIILLIFGDQVFLVEFCGCGTEHRLGLEAIGRKDGVRLVSGLNLDCGSTHSHFECVS